MTRTATGGPPSTSEVYTFTPDAGQTLPAYCPPNTPFVPDYAYANYTHVFWPDRNNYTEPARCLADSAAMVAALPHKRFVFLTPLTGEYSTEFVSQTNYKTIVGIGQGLQAAYPQNVFDVRRYLIDEGLGALGLTPTAQDLTDIANDTVPTQLRYDNVHLTTASYGLVATQAANFLTSKGF